MEYNAVLGDEFGAGFDVSFTADTDDLALEHIKSNWPMCSLIRLDGPSGNVFGASKPRRRRYRR